MTGIKKQTHTHTYTHIKYKPWRKLGRILRGRCTRASRVPRGSIAGRGPWPTGTARWCPPEKHGWQFHSAPSVEEIAAANEIAQVARYHLSMEWEYESERWKGGGCGPIRWMEFTMEDKKRKRAEATHAPLPPFLSNFPVAACCPAKFNPRVLIFVEDAVSKWFPADRRRDALGHPLSLSSIKIRRRGEPWVGRCRFKALCLRQRFRGGKRKRFLMLFLQFDPRVGRRAIDHQVYIGLLCADLMFSSRGDVEGLWRVY